MQRPAWIIRCKTLMRRPTVRVATVLVLGTCLWAMVGRRERVVEHVVAGTSPAVSSKLSATLRPPVSIGVRRLPQRMFSRPAEIEAGPIQADFESTPSVEADTTIHAAGFSVEVTANAPVWLTGTIEYE